MDWTTVVRFLAEARIFSLRYRVQTRCGGPKILLSNGYRGHFLGCKAPVAWSWPLTFNQCWG